MNSVFTKSPIMFSALNDSISIHYCTYHAHMNILAKHPGLFLFWIFFEIRTIFICFRPLPWYPSVTRFGSSPVFFQIPSSTNFFFLVSTNTSAQSKSLKIVLRKLTISASMLLHANVSSITVWKIFADLCRQVSSRLISCS
jgi:hypothetical protein